MINKEHRRLQELYSLQDELAKTRGELEKMKVSGMEDMEQSSEQLLKLLSDSERLRDELRKSKDEKMNALEELQKLKDEMQKMRDEDVKLVEETQKLREDMRTCRRTIDQLNLQVQLKDDGIF